MARSTTISPRRAVWRAPIVACLGLAALGSVSPAASGADASAPSVSTGALDGSVTTFTACDGTSQTMSGPGLLKVERTDASGGPISVNVSYGGTLESPADYAPLPNVVTIAAGERLTILSVEATRSGTVALTVEPGSGYEVGSPATATTTTTVRVIATKCPAEQVQSITLGEAPAAIPVYDRYGLRSGDTVVEIDGDLPPGLTFNSDGTWGGTTSATGTFAFTACYRVLDGDFCVLELPLRITVVAPDQVTPPRPGAPAAPGATPRSGTATFTG